MGRPCRALDAAAKAKLCPLLGRVYKKQQQWRRPQSGMGEVRWDERYERQHLPRGTKPRPLGDSKELSSREVAELYEDSVRGRAGGRATLVYMECKLQRQGRAGRWAGVNRCGLAGGAV